MKIWMRPACLAAVAALALGLAACGDDDEGGAGGGGGGGAVEAGGTTPSETKCGAGTGEKASGEPIRLGALVTKIPGVDFTDITDAAGAYFKCVNDNGGINGRPIEYVAQEHGSDPQQVAALATKLVESEKVLGFVGNTSILDCPANKDFYKENGFNVVIAGVPNDCFQTSNMAALNMGPGYSGLGAASYLRRHGAKKIVVVSPKQPGYEAVHQIMTSDAKKNGIPTVSRLENVPISDPGALVQALVSQAGDGGGVVLDFTPPEGVKILQAAAQQGVIDRVMWGASTPLNDTSVPDAIGEQWDEKLFVNSELAMLDSNGPDMQLYRAVNKKYSPDNPLGSFGQMGFIAAKMVSDVLQDLPEDELDKEGINDAILNIKNYETDILCKPWYFQDMPVHVPNNTDWTVTPKDGKMVEAEGCTDIPATNDDMRTVRSFEAENDVN
jgi:branched-chain amino acid transport system substrate-binding protein